VFVHQKYKKHSKAIQTRTRTQIIQQVSNISKRQCSPTRNIKKQSKAIKTRTRTQIIQQVSNISKRQCLPTRNIKKRVKQLRLEHVHKLYNKCPTYLKGSVRPPEI
jgi:vacuolar-type H+-ATPase subunit E/Vma4